MAPGVSILAAMMPKNEPGSIPFGKKPSEFALKSGTSMACPHVSGAAAFIKSVHRGWTSSMIRSALMTTGTSSRKIGSSAIFYLVVMCIFYFLQEVQVLLTHIFDLLRFLELLIYSSGMGLEMIDLGP